MEKNGKSFEVKGTISLKHGEKNFSKKVIAHSKENAIERIYMLFGSNNKLKRRNVQIKEVNKSE